MTLYGLHHSPRHWSIKATHFLKKYGLEPTPDNTSIFVGNPNGKNTFYLGLYVDDFIYFDETREVKEEFETKMTELTKFYLMVTV